MSTPLVARLDALMYWWMDLCRRRALIVIVALATVASLGGWLAATRLSVNTDSSQMIAADAPFRQAKLDFDKAFPADRDRIALIVRAPTADEADMVVLLVTDRLRERDDVIRDIFAPPADPFFRRMALLYLQTSELERLLARVSQAAPLIKRLDADPSLDALFDALAEGAERMGELSTEQLEEVYDAVAATIEARLGGSPEPMSWQDLFDDEERGDVHQRVISITPELDFGTLRPASGAITAIEEAVAAVTADGRFRAQTYITGDRVLASQELESVSNGITLSFGVSFLVVGVLLFVAMFERFTPLALVRTYLLEQATLAAIVITICITAGVAALLFDALNLVSIAFVVLLVGLGVDYAIHIILHVQEERREGAETPQALRRTAFDIGGALLLTAPTTAAAFLAFAPTRFVGMTQLGVVSAIGVGVAFVVASSFLPACLGILQRLGIMRWRSTHLPGRDRWYHDLARAPVWTGMFVAFAGITAAAGVAAVIFAGFSTAVEVVRVAALACAFIVFSLGLRIAIVFLIHKGAGPFVMEWLERAGVVQPPVEGAARRAGRQGRFLRNLGVSTAIAAGVAAMFVLPFVRFDTDPMSLRDPNSPAVIAYDYLFDDPDTQPYQLSVLRADVDSADAVAERLRALPEIKSAITLSSFVPDDQDEKLMLIDFAALGIDSALSDRSADEPELDAGLHRLRAALELAETEGERSPEAARLADALSAYESALENDRNLRVVIFGDVFAFWPQQLERLRLTMQAEPISLETLPGAIQSRFVGDDGRVRVLIEPSEDLRDPDARRRFVEAVTGVDANASGGVRSILEGGDITRDSVMQAVLTAALATALILWIVLRRIGLVVVILAPLALAAALTSAATVIVGMPYNFANVIVLPLLIGIGVDSGIHMALRAGRSGRPTSVYATATPRAVLFAALTTLASFGSLSLNAHQGVASMGVLLVIAIGFTLVCTLLVQPAALGWLTKAQAARSKENEAA